MKMKKDRGHRKWRPAFDASMDFYVYVLNDDQKVNKGVTCHGVELRWHKVFCTVLKYFGFPKDARTFMWDELRVSSRTTDDDREKAPEQWLEDLAWYVFCYSDRWGLERLLRCHRTYLAYVRACEDQR